MEEGSNKIYKQSGNMLIINALVQDYITAYWYSDPSEFRSLSTKDFLDMIKRDGWEQLN